MKTNRTQNRFKHRVMPFRTFQIGLLLAALLLSCSVQGQQKKYTVPKDVLEKMLASVPTKDGKIFFEETITADPSLKKDQLFTKVRQWFTETFTEGGSALEVNDQQNGLLTGKAAHRYSKTSGLVKNTGYTTFVLQVTVKDGELRYQLYDFNANDNLQGLTGMASTGIKHSYDLDELLQEHNTGKKSNVARKQLDYMNQAVYHVQMALQDLAKG